MVKMQSLDKALGLQCGLNPSVALRLAFLAWGDFHAHSRFACSTVPEEKWGLLVVSTRLSGRCSVTRELKQRRRQRRRKRHPKSEFLLF